MKTMTNQTMTTTRVPLTVPEDPAVVAYTAGMMDGEGNVNIARQTNPSGSISFDVRITIANTYEPVMQWMVDAWGGRYYSQDRRADLGHKTCYLWKVTGANAGVFINAVLPYLVIKREQAALALEALAEQRPPFERYLGIDPRVTQRQLDRIRRLRELNKR